MVEWKFLNNKEEYLISNTGMIFSLRNEIALNLLKDAKGYLTFKNNGKHFKVHRAVALLFVLAPISLKGEKLEVNHIDGNPANNHYTNLEWTTPTGNQLHARIKKRTSKFPGVYKHENKFQTSATINNKLHYFGRYKTEIKAWNVYIQGCYKLGIKLTKYHFPNSLKQSL